MTDYAKEQIDHALSQLRKGQQVTVVYYCSQEQETQQITGTVMKVDAHWKILLVDQVDIDFLDIYEIIDERN